MRTRRRFFWGICVIVASVLVIGLIIAAYRLNWAGTGFSNKTLWDWMQLLIIPRSMTAGVLNLKGADLSRVDMTGANMSDTILEEVNMNGADLRWANLSRATLAKASLSRSQLQKTEARGMATWAGTSGL